MSALEQAWYEKQRWVYLLAPLALLFGAVSMLRRLVYRLGLYKVFHTPQPVIVVGNITAGGTGKTPVVMHVVQALQARGLKPAVISRGYGGRAPSYPFRVHAETDAAESGDEPLLLAQRLQVPVVVDPDRARAAASIAVSQANVLVSDDGLQHYRLGRNAEIVVVDAARRQGNGWLLPVGPLRESARRLRKVDAVLVNGGGQREASFALHSEAAINLLTGERRALSEFAGLELLAIAGTGNPQRFFRQLQAFGMVLRTRAFPDHHAYQLHELQAMSSNGVVMTEKDAVKCLPLARQLHADNWWSVPIELRCNEQAEVALNSVLNDIERIVTTGRK